MGGGGAQQWGMEGGGGGKNRLDKRQTSVSCVKLTVHCCVGLLVVLTCHLQPYSNNTFLFIILRTPTQYTCDSIALFSFFLFLTILDDVLAFH